MPKIVIDPFEIININQKHDIGARWILFNIWRNISLDFQLIQKFCQRISAHFFLQSLVPVNIKAPADNAHNVAHIILYTLVVCAEPLITRHILFRAHIKPGINRSCHLCLCSLIHRFQEQILIRKEKRFHFFIDRIILILCFKFPSQLHQTPGAQHPPIRYIQIKRILLR